jgi:hypothetical protein
MGATDPKKAEKGTIRADFADSIDANAVHGSDAAETAAVEIAYFFPALNVYSVSAPRCGNGKMIVLFCSKGQHDRTDMTSPDQLARLGSRATHRFIAASWGRSRSAPSSCSAGSTSTAQRLRRA